MSKTRNRNRQLVEVVDPRPGTPHLISHWKALEYCAEGVAYFTKEGRLRFRGLDIPDRMGSDVYVDGCFEIRPKNSEDEGRKTPGRPQFRVLQWEHLVRNP